MGMHDKEKERLLLKINKKLKRVLNKNLLPMPHNFDKHVAGIRKEEWLEWTCRHEKYNARNKEYESKFIRPSEETVSKIWEILGEQGSKLHDFAAKHLEFMENNEIDERNFAAKQALVIALHTFIIRGYGILVDFTYLRFFNTLCRAFSDHYRQQYEKPIRIDNVWNMRIDTVKKCRRDLVLTGVDTKKLWDAVIKWEENPFFSVAIDNATKTKTVVNHEQGAEARTKFLSIIDKDPCYGKQAPSGVMVLFKDDKLPDFETRPTRCEVCAERPYNIVNIGDDSKDIIKKQESVVLYLHTSNFKEDYKNARKSKAKALCGLRRLGALTRFKRFGVNVRLVNLPSAPRKLPAMHRSNQRPKTIWSERFEHMYYRSIELGIPKLCYKPVRLTHEEVTDWNKLGKLHTRIEQFEAWIQEYGSDKKRRRIIKWIRAIQKRFEKTIAQLDASTKLVPIARELTFLKVANSMQDWRTQVSCILHEYDVAELHLRTYKNVYEQLENLDGHQAIRSGFDKCINRRYQPIHLWPTTVADTYPQTDSPDPDEIDEEEYEPDSTIEEGDEASQANYFLQTGINKTDEEGFQQDKVLPVPLSYRNRWFQAKVSNDCYQELVGYDISSSLIQIIAAFVGDKEFMKISMAQPPEPSFKEQIIKWVWQERHSWLCIVRQGVVPYEDEGWKDERLGELVKECIMRVSYGSAVGQVQRDQRSNPNAYGPGWKPRDVENANLGGAQLFQNAFDQRYPRLKQFRDMCRRAAELSLKKDKYKCQGLVFTDPFDGANVRWNPVKRKKVPVPSEGDSLKISLPFGFDKNDDMPLEKLANPDGDYPVDLKELKKFAPPCLVHMLDACYSSLVMKELLENDVKTFVGIHDCWLVPLGKINELENAMEDAAAQWDKRLGIVYNELLELFDTRGKKGKEKEEDEHYKLVKEAYENWSKRQETGEKFKFRAKQVPEQILETQNNPI